MTPPSMKEAGSDFMVLIVHVSTTPILLVCANVQWGCFTSRRTRRSPPWPGSLRNCLLFLSCETWQGCYMFHGGAIDHQPIDCSTRLSPWPTRTS